MNHCIRLAILALIAGASVLVAEVPAQTHPDHAASTPTAAPANTSDSFDLEKAKAEYPLDTCVVSGDKLESSDMGDPIDYVHQESGQPDRLVRVCCKSCIRDFKKDPAKYLKAIDDAAAGKPHKADPGAHHH